MRTPYRFSKNLFKLYRYNFFFTLKNRSWQNIVKNTLFEIINICLLLFLCCMPSKIVCKLHESGFISKVCVFLKEAQNPESPRVVQPERLQSHMTCDDNNNNNNNNNNEDYLYSAQSLIKALGALQNQ